MINRFNGATATLAQFMARQPAYGLSVAKTARALLNTAHHTLTAFGLSAVALIVLLVARPDLANALSRFLMQDAPQEALVVQAPVLSALMAPAAAAPATPSATPVAAPVQAAPTAAEKSALLGVKKQQKYVTSWLSKRYRVAGDAANMLVSTAYQTASEIKLDPLLILAVMAIESGLNPFAESAVGAQGLMQVMSKVHHDKFQDLGGVKAALNPVANIRVGSLILKDYVTRGGSIEAGLKTYVGAGAFESDSGYGSRVLAEYQRLKQVAIGKRVPTSAATALAQKEAPAKAGAPVRPALKSDQIAGLM